MQFSTLKKFVTLTVSKPILSQQLMLKRVLLAYARWNKSIGYCQGFNMLAAIILEVMDKSESHALKVRALSSYIQFEGSVSKTDNFFR